MRLTRTGRGLLAGSVLAGVLGALAGLPVLVGLAVAGVLAVVLATSAVMEAPKIDVSRSASPAEVDRGRPAHVLLQFRGTSRRRPRPFTVIETVAGERRTAALERIGYGHVKPLTYEVETSRRGKVVAGPLVLRRSDPFGLVVAERRIGGTCAVSVRPRRHHVRMLPSGRQRDLEGPTREVSRGTSSFHQLREYVPGDDLRHIHWRTTARTGELMVKQLVDTTRPEVVVILDNRRAVIGEDDFEAAVEVAASVLHAAETDGFPTQLLFADGHDEVGLDGQSLPHIERLTDVERSDGDSMDDMGRALRGRGRSLVFVTGELPAPDLQLVSTIARRFSPAYLVSVVADRRAPFVTPPGVVGVPCASAEAFAAEWAVVK